MLDARPREFHLIETMRHEAGRGLRVARRPPGPGGGVGRAYFGFRFDAAAVRAALAARLAGAGDARVRLRCYRDGALGVDVEGLPAPAAGPVRLAIDPEPIDSTQCWPHHKTSLREPYTSRLARHRAPTTWSW